MSFLVNNIELQEIYFNNQMVKSAYYNNELVWTSHTEPYDWVGWDNATWEDIYNLCQDRQNGVITADEFTSLIGESPKTITLTSAVQGATEINLSPDIVDSSGKIGFVAEYLLPEPTTLDLYSYNGREYPGVTAILNNLDASCDILNYSTYGFQYMHYNTVTATYPTANERIKTTSDGIAREWWVGRNTSNLTMVGANGNFGRVSVNTACYVLPYCIIG